MNDSSLIGSIWQSTLVDDMIIIVIDEYFDPNILRVFIVRDHTESAADHYFSLSYITKYCKRIA